VRTRDYLSRRAFLSMLGVFAAIGFVQPAGALAGLGGSAASDPLVSKLARFFTQKESASRVGREYLRCVPGEADARLLVDLICSTREERRKVFAGADKGKLRELLMLQQRRDFESGRTVNVRGWILSQTEVRLCALAALI
jgi:hypothetical protein